jgi:hypothetical protein
MEKMRNSFGELDCNVRSQMNRKGIRRKESGVRDTNDEMGDSGGRTSLIGASAGIESVSEIRCESSSLI